MDRESLTALVNRHVGSQLKKCREAANLSLGSLASEVEISLERLTRCEEGLESLLAVEIVRLSIAIRVNPTNFLRGLPKGIVPKKIRRIKNKRHWKSYLATSEQIELGSRLKRWRAGHAFTQLTVAQRAGVNPKRIQDLENNRPVSKENQARVQKLIDETPVDPAKGKRLRSFVAPRVTTQEADESLDDMARK